MPKKRVKNRRHKHHVPVHQKASQTVCDGRSAKVSLPTPATSKNQERTVHLQTSLVPTWEALEMTPFYKEAYQKQDKVHFNSTWKEEQYCKNFTLNDFANSEVKRGHRLQKAVLNAPSQRGLVSGAKWCAEWHEHSFHDNLGEYDERITKDGKPSQVEKTTETPTVFCQELTIELWEHISTFVEPPDVKTFALINNKTCSIVNNSRFWYNLYNRYYDANLETIPARLMPFCMDSIPGLRARTIRMLFYTYPTFTVNTDFPSNNCSLAKGQKCIGMSFKKSENDNEWYFTFKLSKKRRNCKDLLRCASSQRSREVFHNPEDLCSVLKIKSSDYVYLPPVLGMVVFSINLNLTSDMVHNKLVITFVDGNICGNKSRAYTGTTINFEPVLSVDLFPWYHPKYPYDYIEYAPNEPKPEC